MSVGGVFHKQRLSPYCEMPLQWEQSNCVIPIMCTVADLGAEIAELAARLDSATHRLLECIRQFDQSNEWYAQGAVSCAHWLCWRIGLDQGIAREKVRVARVLGELPKIDDALRVGKLSYAKVRALTRVATATNEAQLLDLALAATGAQLERIWRGYRSAKSQDRPCLPENRSVRRRLLPGGMVKLEIVLSPDEALRRADGQACYRPDAIGVGRKHPDLAAGVGRRAQVGPWPGRERAPLGRNAAGL